MGMKQSNPEREKRLAEALRANLRKRKEQARVHVPEPSHGTDEEGDAPSIERGAGDLEPH